MYTRMCKHFSYRKVFQINKFRECYVYLPHVPGTYITCVYCSAIQMTTLWRMSMDWVSRVEPRVYLNILIRFLSLLLLNITRPMGMHMISTEINIFFIFSKEGRSLTNTNNFMVESTLYIIYIYKINNSLAFNFLRADNSSPG